MALPKSRNRTIRVDDEMWKQLQEEAKQCKFVSTNGYIIQILFRRHMESNFVPPEAKVLPEKSDGLETYTDYFLPEVCEACEAKFDEETYDRWGGAQGPALYVSNSSDHLYNCRKCGSSDMAMVMKTLHR